MLKSKYATVQDKRVLVFHEEAFQLPAQISCCEMICEYVCVSEINFITNRVDTDFLYTPTAYSDIKSPAPLPTKVYIHVRAFFFREKGAFFFSMW